MMKTRDVGNPIPIRAKMKKSTKTITLTFNVDGDLSPEVEADLNQVMVEVCISLCKQVEDAMYRSMISMTRHPKIPAELKSFTVDIIAEDAKAESPAVVENKEEVSHVVPATEDSTVGSEVSG